MRAERKAPYPPRCALCAPHAASGCLDRQHTVAYSPINDPSRASFAMTSLVHSCQVWLRRSVPVSNSRQAWEERLGVVLSLAGIIVVWWSAKWLPLWQQACLWSLLVLTVTILLRHG